MPRITSKIMLIFTILTMDLLTGMELDLFVPSFPVIQNEFMLSPFLVETLLSANFFGYCISLAFVGGLADRFGRKPIILIGLLLFLVGSVLCLFATSYPSLLIGRFLQGIGIAAPAILSFLIIADTYPMKQQQFYMAILNGVMNTAAAIAPVVGSYLTLYFHWQGNFTALFLLGLFAFVMTILFIPSYPALESKQSLSLRSYLPLLKTKHLMLLITCLACSFAPYWIFVGISPLLYMKDLGVSLAHFGFYQGSFGLVFGLGSLAFGYIISRLNQTKWLYIALTLYITGVFSIGFTLLVSSSNPLTITLALMPFNIALIMPSVILYPLCLNILPNAKGRISALMQGTRLIFSASALQIAGYFYHHTFLNIGIILISFIIIASLLLAFVMKNTKIMQEIK